MISIIIPVLNEAKTIEDHLRYIINNGFSRESFEILVVDGESIDNTLSVVQGFIDKLDVRILLIEVPRGRAVQMNRGAEIAKGDILYFLHADSYPPKHFDRLIQEAVEVGKSNGCFRMKFDQSSTLLRVSQWFTRFNFKICRGGDQSLFIKKEDFNSLGGYNEDYIIYEDCELINRIYDRYGFTVLPQYINTSARRYSKNGTWRLQYHFTIIHLKKLFGEHPQKLYQYYLKHIES